MPYITHYNSHKILNQVDLDKMDLKDLSNLYKSRLWLLSQKEQIWLSGAKSLFGNPEQFLSSMYIKNRAVDTKRFIYEGYLPAYHDDKNCERLNSSYSNFEIPVEIIHKGDSEIEKFRKWFKLNQSLLENEPSRFLTRLEVEFSLKNPPTKISGDNSGVVDFENVNIDTLEKEIDQLLEHAQRFYYQSEVHKNTIDLNGGRSYFHAKGAKKDTIIYIWHHSYKEKLKQKMITYYRLKLNPELEFSGNLLKALNFRACSNCCKIEF